MIANLFLASNGSVESSPLRKFEEYIDTMNIIINNADVNRDKREMMGIPLKLIEVIKDMIISYKNLEVFLAKQNNYKIYNGPLYSTEIKQFTMSGRIDGSFL